MLANTVKLCFKPSKLATHITTTNSENETLQCNTTTFWTMRIGNVWTSKLSRHVPSCVTSCCLCNRHRLPTQKSISVLLMALFDLIFSGGGYWTNAHGYITSKKNTAYNLHLAIQLCQFAERRPTRVFLPNLILWSFRDIRPYSNNRWLQFCLRVLETSITSTNESLQVLLFPPCPEYNSGLYQIDNQGKSKYWSVLFVNFSVQYAPLMYENQWASSPGEWLNPFLCNFLELRSVAQSSSFLDCWKRTYHCISYPETLLY